MENQTSRASKIWQIINEKWYESKDDNIGEERIRMVTAAAKLIIADMRCHEQQRNVYPVPSQVRNIQELLYFILLSLRTMLECIIPKVVNVCSIGHAIMQCAMPRTVLSPLQFDVALELDLI